MYQFSDQDKEGGDFAERLPFGVNAVVITDARAATTDSDKDYIELDVENAAGIAESVRVWFTEKSAKYSFATLRQIVVHNADEVDKGKARMAVESVKDSDELVALIKKRTIGGEAWVEKYYDPARTYQGSDGNTYRSVNTNLRGYEPKLKPELLDEPQSTTSAVEDAFPGTVIEPNGTIPNDDAWGK